MRCRGQMNRYVINKPLVISVIQLLIVNYQNEVRVFFYLVNVLSLCVEGEKRKMSAYNVDR